MSRSKYESLVKEKELKIPKFFDLHRQKPDRGLHCLKSVKQILIVLKIT